MLVGAAAPFHPVTQASDNLPLESAEFDGLSPPARRKATVALMIATAMQAFDLTIVNVALPRLQASFGGDIGLGAWVMTSYLCASAVTALLCGALRRRYGAKQLFSGAIGFFVATSLMCSLAPSAGAIILFRLLQGAGAGFIQPLAQATLLDIHPKPAHGRMLAILGATLMTGPVLGPALGGFVTDIASWRWIFVINLPLGAIAIFGLRWLPAELTRTQDTSIDALGMLLLIVGVGALQLALERSVGPASLLSPEVLAEAATAATALMLIAVQSWRRRFKLFRFEVFKNLNFATSSFCMFAIAALMTTTIVLVPALGEGPLGFSATLAGLTLAPRGGMTLLTMLAMARMIDRINHRVLLAAGLVLTAAAFEFIARVPPAHAAAWLAGASALQGLGVGLLFTPLSTLAFATLGEELRTDAAGVYNLLRQLGGAAGVAVMAGVLQLRREVHLAAQTGPHRLSPAAAGPLHTAAILAAYYDCFHLMAVAAIAVIPAIFVFRVIPRGGPEQDPA